MVLHNVLVDKHVVQHLSIAGVQIQLGDSEGSLRLPLLHLTGPKKVPQGEIKLLFSDP